MSTPTNDQTAHTCPKCQQKMILGFIPDFAHNSVVVSAWHEGQPKKSFWKGTDATYAKGLPLGAFRCPSCGFIEFYADRGYQAV